MSESNGVFKIQSMGTGRKPVQFGNDDDPVALIDVVETYNELADEDRKFQGEDGKIAPDKQSEWNKARWGFVFRVIDNCVPDKEAAERMKMGLSEAHALFFCAWLQDEANKLIPFFKLKSAEKRSSPESSPIATSYE